MWQGDYVCSVTSSSAAVAERAKACPRSAGAGCSEGDQLVDVGLALQKIGVLESKIRTLIAVAQRECRRADALSRQLESVSRDQADETGAETAALREDLERVRGEAAAYEEQHHQLASELERVQEEAERYRVAAQKQADAREQLTRELVALRAAVSEREAAEQEQSASTERLMQELDRLRTENRALREAAENGPATAPADPDAERRIAELAAELEDARRQVERLRGAKEAARERLQALLGRIEELERNRQETLQGTLFEG